MDAARAVDAQNAPTAPWKTAQNAVSHSAHTHHCFSGPRNGTDVVNTLYTRNSGQSRLPPPDWLPPIVAKLFVTAGQTYPVWIMDGAPWDYDPLNLPFVLTTSIQGSPLRLREPRSLAPRGGTPGDYDGDGKTDIAVYRPSTGQWIVLFPTKSPQYVVYQWGIPNDVPEPGDYDGDGKTDITVYRPSTGLWIILLSSTDYSSYVTRQWGLATDIPVPADYDGDSRTDMAVYRPSTGVWFVLSSFNPPSYTAYQWGLSGDIPVTHEPSLSPAPTRDSSASLWGDGDRLDRCMCRRCDS